ncbi:hypothetical protein ACQ33O_08315 [Ferruginibacter sp. SUN002]|uniref:hypothetical protein n=1 Tax=Ferruginibacter sp. SUN002 TaxID=2937789 RepID=UPI003D3670D4
MKNSFISFINKKDHYVVITAWVIFQLIWIAVFGFDFQGESNKYIREANLFVTNNGFTQHRYIFYSTTILLIVFSNLIKIGLHGAVFMVMFINLVCYLKFYKSLNTLFKDKLPAVLVVIFLMVFWPYQRWTVTLYSEGIFYSLVMLLCAVLISYKKLSLKYLLGLSTVLSLLILTRPMGVLFIIPVAMFIYFHLVGRQKIFFLLTLIAGGILINEVSQIVFTTTADWDMKKALQSDIIIADKDDYPVNNAIILSDSRNQLYQLIFYITHNFSHFIMLATKRLQAFFFLVRNYYSTLHNLFLLAPVACMYLLIIFYFNKIRTVLGRPLLVFMLSSIFFFALAVSLQFDDYHNRFFLLLMPILTVMALAGIFHKHLSK